MQEWKAISRRPWYQHLAFWVCVLICYMIANLEHHHSWPESLNTYAVKVSMQAFVAYYLLLLVIPTYYQEKGGLLITPQIIGLLLLIQGIDTTWRYYYLEPTYPMTHATCIARYGHLSYTQRLFDVVSIFFKNPATYLPPAFILIAIQYFQKQQEMAELNEQKHRSEIMALKNQMNPHFLFNTLNNLYALALKRSEQTPEVIGKLSEILDYMLYRCNDKYVSLDKEIELLHNYLSLEKIRYGSRVDVNFVPQVDHAAQIAPLLLLHFVENAFKHGVSQELGQALFEIDLQTTPLEIRFVIKNSIPDTPIAESQQPPIGLRNIKRQLNLLYPKRHELTIDHAPHHYSVHLNIFPL